MISIQQQEGLYSIFDESVKFGKSVFEKYQNTEFKTPFKEGDAIKFISINIIERIIKHLRASLILITNEKYFGELESEIGQLLRPIMLDLLNYNYIKFKWHDNKEDGEEYAHKLLADGQTNQQKKFDQNIFPKEKLKRMKLNYEKAYSFLVHGYKSQEKKNDKFVFGNFPSPSDIIKEFRKDDEFKSLENAYKVYEYYSKYAHFSFMTFQIRNISENFIFSQRLKSVQLGLITLKVCSQELGFNYSSELELVFEQINHLGKEHTSTYSPST